MNIIETNIPNINSENINQSKLNLSNKIIQRIHPLFDDVISDKLSKINIYKKELEEKHKQVLKNKNLIENLVNSINRKKKIKKLLERLNKLTRSGIIMEGSMKNETIILLKVIDTLTDDKLTYHLNETLRMVSKRF